MPQHVEPRTAARMFQSLSLSGQPPKLGAGTINVGTEKLLGKLQAEYLAGYLPASDGLDGGGACKWIEADHGNGKTQFLRCTQEMAWDLEYLTAFVELSQDECPLDHPELIYASVARALQARPGNLSDVDRSRGIDIALPQLLDQRFPGVLTGVPDEQLRGEAAEWVQTTLASTPVESSALRQAVCVLLLAKLAGDEPRARLAATFLRGEPIPAADLRDLGVYEACDRSSGFRMLRSLCQLVQRGGLATGTVLLFDEARRSLSLISAESQKVACENLLSIINRCNSGELPGTLLLYAVMPEFFTEFAVLYPALQQRCGPATRINLNRIAGLDEMDLLCKIGERICDVGKSAFEDFPLSQKVIKANLRLVAEQALRLTMGSGCRRLFVKSWVQILLDQRGHRMRPLTLAEVEEILTGAAGAMDELEPLATIGREIDMATITGHRRLNHKRFGPCELLRVEGTDWIVRAHGSDREQRFPSSARAEFEPAAPEPSEPPTLSRRLNPASITLDAPVAPTMSKTAVRLKLIRMLESLRMGLPPYEVDSRAYAVGAEPVARACRNLLYDVAMHGGHAIVFRGAYGQGKSFSLKLLQDIARDVGYLVARTEIDGAENQLTNPHHVYRELMRHLVLPGTLGRGVGALAEQVALRIGSKLNPNHSAEQRARTLHHWFDGQLGCPPIAWLMSDPNLAQKPELLNLLAGEASMDLDRARRCHVLPGTSRQWPAFNASTQGDLASFLLSGIGRLSRLLGFKGFILMLDEMEKWQDLNWKQQATAGNLLGGLIWGATAPEGQRGRNDHPPMLTHSSRDGGHPFTTSGRNHIGIAIGMTPRGEVGPEQEWSYYSPLEIVDLPYLTSEHLVQLAHKISPQYGEAYGLTPPNLSDLSTICRDALAMWNEQGQTSTRLGVQSVIAAFDNWRERA